MKYEVKKTTKFKKDYKKFNHDEKIVLELRKVLTIISNWGKLPEKYMDHKLKWDYKDMRECHIKPDLLLVYKIDDNKLILLLLRLWSHSEIF